MPWGASARACAGILTLLNIFNILNCVRSIWNIIFGVLMIFLQLNWKQMINRNFGFLNHWFLRGCFYIFVGTNVMHPMVDGQEFQTWFSWLSGAAACFVGVVELMFGFKCAPESETSDMETGKKGGLQNAQEPTLNVNITPNQIGQAANWAAQNPNTVAAVGGAVASGAQAANNAGGGAAANPFFGNAHCNQR